MEKQETQTESVFAYFGDTSEESIEEVLGKTFEIPFQRIKDSWIIKGNNGVEYSIRRQQNGWSKFLELFADSAEELSRVSEEYSLYLTDETLAETVRDSFTHWLDFRIAVPPHKHFQDGYADICALKNNYLITNEGIALEIDEWEATVLHPCGDGVWGDYLY